ncbi:DUF1015 domain-containing protein [Thermosulfurimonas marina]|uniref:DUF1015 domain-containing protein n=1 Tax=Thermosulfurimonas marina TaxID=2047767 RepID=A0A6H1WTD5_9BACT|nr:DUF1015 domain-containing protein [Thermosulfurimonas marina]QJA06386.1 DUF1015 domain-containing protein [Thermosulfurimonas marina]
MPEVKPFYGWRFNPQKVDLARVVAPPYDVVSPEEKAAYLARDPHNIFHLELASRPEEASRKLETWISEGVLIRESRPALYLYRLHFTHQGQKFVRTGFIGLVRLSPFSEGRILPHEKTFPKVTEERLALLRATKAQFSQIFVLYSDPKRRTLSSLPEASPLLRVKFQDEIHEILALTDPSLQKTLTDFWEDLPFYIADGHHRYTTALRYAEEMTRALRPEGPRCFHYMMMYLCPFEDPGLVVLPTHRILRHPFSPEELSRRLLPLVHLEEDPKARPSLEEKALVLLSAGRRFRMRLRPEALERWRAESGLPEEALPAAWCARIIETLCEEGEKDLKEKGLLSYTPREEEVEHEAIKGALGFLLPATPLEALARVAASGKVMPHKSTYFHPKILTGTVIFRLNPQSAPPCP